MKKNEQVPAQVEISRYLGLGLTWALSTLLFLWLGTLVDKRMHTEPVFTLLGALIGAAAGFYHLYHELMKRPARRVDEGKEPGE